MSIHNPVQELSHEHEYILKVVNGMRVIEEKLVRGEDVDVALLGKIVRFMRNFADKYHHAKEEDILFPAMEEKGVPQDGCPLGALKAEHVKGRRLVGELEAAAADFARGSSEAREELVATLAALGQLYPGHIWKEDEMVFPMTERLFGPQDLQKLQAAFARVEAEYENDHGKYVAFAQEMEVLSQKGRRGKTP